MTNAAIEYVLDQLFQIADPNKNVSYVINIDKLWESPAKQVVVEIPDNDAKITFYLAQNADWYRLIGDPSNKIEWVNNRNKTFKIPVLFWGQGKTDLPFMTIENEREISVHGDIISSSFFMLSRWEEKQSTDLDIHGRFKYKNSVAFKYNFVTIPIVDEYAMLLRYMLSILLPGFAPSVGQFSIKLSHDIDYVRRFPSNKQAVRTIVGDIIKTRHPSILGNSLRDYMRSMRDPGLDPYLQSIYELAQTSRFYGMQSSFYFMSAQKGPFDSGYNIEDVEECIRYLQDEGHEVGFHAGYETLSDYDRFSQERQTLDMVFGSSDYGGRQHYLRFDINTTWRYWDQAGLKYDSTLGYAEHEGFRCGTCHPFHPFDIESDSVLGIQEIPLIVMDGTLKGYRSLSTWDALQSILDLRRKCESVEGVFTVLWHNTSIGREWTKWYHTVYLELLKNYG